MAAVLAALLLPAGCDAAPRAATTADRAAVVEAAEAAGSDCATRGLGGNTPSFRACFTERLDARLTERGLRLPLPSDAAPGAGAPTLPGRMPEAQIQELLRRNPRCSRVGGVVYC